MTDRRPELRILEAVLFAAAEPVSEARLAARVGDEADIRALLTELQAEFESRGVNLVRVGNAWAFRTAPDLAPVMRVEQTSMRKLSRAAVETLAIIAYHQPVTRAEIEEIRGVSHSKGTLDTLLEAGWIKPGRRRMTPGRPVTWLTTPGFLDHFGLENIKDLPGLDDLRAAGLLDTRPAIQAFRGIVVGDDDTPEDEEDDDNAEEVEADESRAALDADGPEGGGSEDPEVSEADESDEDGETRSGAGGAADTILRRVR